MMEKINMPQILSVIMDPKEMIPNCAMLRFPSDN